MPDYKWPEAQERRVMGRRVSRLDGPEKATGRAKYTYDVHPAGMLYGIIVRSPHAHARIKGIDTSAAEKSPGVKAVKILQTPGTEVFWGGDEIVALAAIDEQTAEDAARKVKVEYEVLPWLVSDAEPPSMKYTPATGPITYDELTGSLLRKSNFPDVLKQRGLDFRPDDDLLGELKDAGVPADWIELLRNATVKDPEPPVLYRTMEPMTQGDPDKAFAEAEIIHENIYGLPVITHIPLETHGAVSEWPDKDNVVVHTSTQNVSGIPSQMAQPLGIPAANIQAKQQHIGGAFGSKFGIGRWGIASAQLSKLAGGKPVRLMLERKHDQEAAGCRPSTYGRIKLAANKDGRLTGWESLTWGTGGVSGSSMPQVPYILRIPNQRKTHTAITNHIGPSQAWRAPGQQQACVLTMCAFDDLAAKLNMDPVDFLLKNIDMAGQRAQVYREEIAKAVELSDWKKLWHPRSHLTPGTMKRGLGIAIHTWAYGGGHESHCDLTVYPDGAVEVKTGTQDLGTGTRTVIAIVAAETLGIPVENIRLLIGDSRYPMSGASGGSTTVGGVGSATRRAAVDARDQLFAKVAPALNANVEELEAAEGVIRVKADPKRSIAWKQACAKLGALPITVRGNNPDRTKPPALTEPGVGGCEVADVSVDIETGIVKVNRMALAQDCGIIVDQKTAESQAVGAMTMGVSYTLFEEKVMCQKTGCMLNPNFEFYRIAGIGDIPEFKVHFMTGKLYEDRGVIGLGEPPCISPGAAISNAVANAIGVRVPFLPITPDRVLAALERRRA